MLSLFKIPFIPVSPFLVGAILTFSAPSLPGQSGGAIEQLWLNENYGPVTSAASLDDVNGDGIPDFATGSFGSGSSSGKLSVYSGADYSEIWSTSLQVGPICSISDLDSDGHSDLIAVNNRPFSNTAAAYSGISGSLLFNLSTPPGYTYFQDLADIGDINSDGISDIAASSVYLSDGSVFLYSGADGSLINRLDSPWPEADFGHSIASLGDLDGDNISELLIGAPGSSSTGSASRAVVISLGTRSVLYQFSQYRHWAFGQSVAALEDADGDGITDFVIAAPMTNGSQGYSTGDILIYSGSTGVLLKQYQGQPYEKLGWDFVEDAGDIDRDGLSDVMVSKNHFRVSPAYILPKVAFYSSVSSDVLYEWKDHDLEYQDREVFGANLGDSNQDGIPEMLIGISYGFAIWPINKLEIHSFTPGVFPIATGFSASAGATLDFEINFPDAAAQESYRVLISASGVGSTLFGVEIPLQSDSFTLNSFLGIYPFSNYSGLQGTLNNHGNAIASITAPANAYLGMIGRTFHLAAIANPSGFLPNFSSVAVPVTIHP